jgi:hypothetical protein
VRYFDIMLTRLFSLPRAILLLTELSMSRRAFIESFGSEFERSPTCLKRLIKGEQPEERDMLMRRQWSEICKTCIVRISAHPGFWNRKKAGHRKGDIYTQASCFMSRVESWELSDDIDGYL